MGTLKRAFKRNTHTGLFKALAGFGRSLNRLYENRNHDIQSNGELTVLRKIALTNPSVVIDGGANNGEYSLLMSELSPSCKIYAFEPVEKTFRNMEKVTRTQKNVIPVKKGLYKEKCTMEINVYETDVHSSLYDIQGLSYAPEHRDSIDLVTGDSFLEENNINEVDLLKIDIEGAEYDALVGFQESIEKGKIKAIQFEYGYINISTRRLLIDFYEFLETRGYILGKIYPKTVEFRKYQLIHEDFIGPNFIAVKKTETNLIGLLERV